MNCEHNTTRRQKFNGGNPVYVCDACDTIVGYVYDPVTAKIYIETHKIYMDEMNRLTRQTLDQDFPDE